MKKSISRVFILLLVLLLPVGMSAKGDPFGNQKSVKDELSNPQNKLSGPLRQLVEIYKNKTKLEGESLAGLSLQRIGRSAKSFFQKKTPGPQNPFSKSVLRDYLIDPVLQERWGNPPYDVLNCYIKIIGDTTSLKRYNLKIRAEFKAGLYTILNAEIASPELGKISEHLPVRTISLNRPKEANNNLGSNSIGASRLRLKQQGRFTKGYTGEDVVVGVIDTGIDWTHEDFCDPKTGRTRIQYIWDTSNNTGPHPAELFGGNLSGLDYGTVWTRADIDAGLCTETDTNGHGTHTSGTAAGNGSATGNYAGAAPNADIVFVKGLDNNGILFIYEMADRLKKPCTVNMSYGPYLPLLWISIFPEDLPADGTSLDAQFVRACNNQYGAGHIPVKSAGNEGYWNTHTQSRYYIEGAQHAEGQLTGGSRTHVFSCPDPHYYAWIYSGCWYDHPFRITLTSPEGDTYLINHGTTGSQLSSGGHVAVLWDFNHPPESNGFYTGGIEIITSNLSTEGYFGDWEMVVEPLTGSVNYDFWISDDWPQFGVPNYTNFTGNFKHSNYILDFAAGPDVITVGSHNTRTTWDAIDGGQYTFNYWGGAISDFSSPGPSRDRRIKPDVSAPGSAIISSLSKDASTADPLTAPDGRHQVMQGTSMATPHVTGAVALILQKYPNISFNTIKNYLTKSAIEDLHVRSMRDSKNAFGYGKANVIWLNDPPTALIAQDKQEVILDNKNYQVTYSGDGSYDPEAFPLTYSWVLTQKPEGAAPDFSGGGSSAQLQVDPDIPGLYQVSLTVSDGIEESEVVFSQSLEARFYPLYPPENFQIRRIVNDLLFAKEYIDKLVWSKNPENKIQVDKYRLYRKPEGTGDDAYTLVKELDNDQFGFEERGLTKDQRFIYRITSVNFERNAESDPVEARVM